MICMAQSEIPIEIIYLIFGVLVQCDIDYLIVLSKTSQILNKVIKLWYLQTLFASSQLSKSNKKIRIRLNCNKFAVSGHINLLEWMKDTVSNDSWCFYNKNYYPGLVLIPFQIPLTEITNSNFKENTICKKAIKGGHLELLKWAKKNNCKLDSDLYLVAARYNQMIIIQWLYENGIKTHRDMSIVAAKYNNFNILKWSRKKGCRWHKEICYHAAKNNNFEMLLFARKGGCPWNEKTFSAAALNNNFEMLNFLRENSCPWNGWTCSSAALNNNFEMLKWLRENNCPWNEWTCSSAAANGQLNVLKWLKENGCPWNEWTCSSAAANGQLNVLKWLKENGCPWNEWICSEAAVNGHLEVLKWATQNGCPTYELQFVIDRIVSSGYLHILKWLCETRIFDNHNKKSIYENSIINGQIEILHWLLDDDKYQISEIPIYSIDTAIRNNHLHVIKFLHERNVEFNEYHYDVAVDHNHSKMIHWMIQNGCNLIKCRKEDDPDWT